MSRKVNLSPHRSLSGKKILVTRERAEAEKMADLLRTRGAEPIVMPMIELCPPKDPGRVVSALGRMHTCDWVVFTSANGVRRVAEALRAAGKDARALGNAKIAAIGSATAGALPAQFLREADLVPGTFVGEALAEDLLGALVKTRSEVNRPPKVMIFRAALARDVVPDALSKAGCDVETVAVYETRPPSPDLAKPLRAALSEGGIDAVAFTSSSTVDNFCDLLQAKKPHAAELLARTRVASIGAVTTLACVKRGIRVDVTASSSTVAGLVESLETGFLKGIWTHGDG